MDLRKAILSSEKYKLLDEIPEKLKPYWKLGISHYQQIDFSGKNFVATYNFKYSNLMLLITAKPDEYINLFINL